VSDIAIIYGTRPQIIKAVVLSSALKKSGLEDHVMIDTGQHYDAALAGSHYQTLSAPGADYQLNIGKGTEAQQVAQIIERSEKLLLKLKPRRVIVLGDTNSTLGGALAASKLKIPLLHIEAGVRSYNRKMSEEINRIVTDHLAEQLMTTHADPSDNLIREGIDSRRIHIVGDLLFDAALTFSKRNSLEDVFRENSLPLKSGEYVLATLHRAETVDSATHLSRVIAGLEELASKICVVMPLHPRTQARLAAAGIVPRWLKLVAPVSYLNMLALEKNAKLLITDSGGVQREGYFLGVPTIVLRRETEWTQLVTSGHSYLVNPEESFNLEEAMVAMVENFQNSPETELFGAGMAATRICEILANDLNLE